MRAELYRLYSRQDELLYVGVSVCAARRLYQHSRSASWFPEVARMEVTQFTSRILALTAEQKAIREDKPKYNQVVISDSKIGSAAKSPAQFPRPRRRNKKITMGDDVHRVAMSRACGLGISTPPTSRRSFAATTRTCSRRCGTSAACNQKPFYP